MTCDECREMIPEHVEKSLPADAARELRAHLDACEPCRRERLQTEALLAAARSLPRQEPEAETVLKISQVIHQSAPARRRGEFGPVLDVDDLADYLRVDKAVIEMYLDELPHFELGGKLLFRRQSVDRWIEVRERSTAFQINDAFMGSAVVPNP